MVKGKLMSTPQASNGYRVTTLSKEGRSRTYNVHALVADAFLGPRPEGHVVDHIDYDRGNPDVKNLEYIPHGENLRRGYRQRGAD